MLDEIYRISLKSLVSVSVLFILTRIMGKKQISQLTLFDYAVGISIGSISGDFAIENSISYLEGIFSMTIYAIFTIILSLLGLKFYKLRSILNGSPIIIIERGKINEQGLKKSRMNMNSLLALCRTKDVFDISDIEFAVLETNGEISIQLKSSNKPLTPKDMKMNTTHKSICPNLIIDGNVIDKNLKLIGKDINWLKKELHKNSIENINKVLFAYLDDSDKINIYLKDDNPNNMIKL